MRETLNVMHERLPSLRALEIIQTDKLGLVPRHERSLTITLRLLIDNGRNHWLADDYQLIGLDTQVNIKWQ